MCPWVNSYRCFKWSLYFSSSRSPCFFEKSVNRQWHSETSQEDFNFQHFCWENLKSWKMHVVPNPLSSVKMFVYKIHIGVKQLRSRASGRIDLESVWSDLHYGSPTCDHSRVEKLQPRFPFCVAYKFGMFFFCSLPIAGVYVTGALAKGNHSISITRQRMNV